MRQIEQSVEQNRQNIEIGDKVALVYPWQQDELPTDANFHFTTVRNVFYKDMGTCQLLKFELDGVEYPATADRLILVEKGSINQLPAFVALKENDCHTVYAHAYGKGFRGRVIAWNHDRTQYEVESDNKVYKIVVHYSDISDGIFGSCECLHFVNRRKVCKHLSLVAISDIYRTVDLRMAA
jgi:hypothetical protein